MGGCAGGNDRVRSPLVSSFGKRALGSSGDFDAVGVGLCAQSTMALVFSSRFPFRRFGPVALSSGRGRTKSPRLGLSAVLTALFVLSVGRNLR